MIKNCLFLKEDNWRAICVKDEDDEGTDSSDEGTDSFLSRVFSALSHCGMLGFFPTAIPTYYKLSS